LIDIVVVIIGVLLGGCCLAFWCPE